MALVALTIFFCIVQIVVTQCQSRENEHHEHLWMNLERGISGNKALSRGNEHPEHLLSNLECASSGNDVASPKCN